MRKKLILMIFMLISMILIIGGTALAADSILMEETFENASTNKYILGNSTISQRREDVAKISIETSIPSPLPDGAWDVSKAGNGSVYAYLTVNETDSTKYDLHIAGNGGVTASSGYYLFAHYTSCTEINLSNLDISNVVGMTSMFSNCSSLTSLELGNNFDTSSVTNMGEMFGNCTSLTSLDLGEKFNTSNVLRMEMMFYYCSSLTDLNLGKNFNTSKVYSMWSMFSGCSSLTSLDLGNKFYTSSVEDMEAMFSNCSLLTSLTLGGNFNTSKVEDMSWMFAGCSVLKSLSLGNNFNTSKVTNMFAMFSGCNALTSLNLGGNFNTSSVESMNAMFSGCSALTSLNLGENFNTSQVTDMSAMFSNCAALTSLNLGNKFDTSSVTNMSYMFGQCVNLETLNLGGNFNTSSVTNMMSMFANCEKLTSLSLGSNFDTSKVENMYWMFSGCGALTNLNFGSKFDTSSVENMSYMFSYCTALTNLDLGSKFNTSSAKNMSGMFNNCTALTNLNLGENFDTSKATDMSFMFAMCETLSSINLGSKFDTSNVTDMARMFMRCSSLTSIPAGIDLSNTNITSVSGFTNMFYGCSSLTSARINSKYIGEGMFDDCSNLTDITITSDVQGVYANKYCFRYVDGYLNDSKLKTNLTDESSVMGDYDWSADNRVLIESPTLTIEPINVTVGKTKEFTYTYSGDGDISAVVGSDTIATISIDKVNKKITVTGNAVGDTVLILTSAKTDNYKSASATATITVKEYKEPILMTETTANAANEYVLGNSTIEQRRENIHKISIETEIPSPLPDGAWDVSKEGNGSVYAWITTSNSQNTVHIAGDEGVIASSGYYLFYGYKNCTEITGLSNLDTSKVTNMQSMFYYCSSLTTLDLGEKFDTSNVTDMNAIFGFCNALTSLDLGEKFNTSNVTDMGYMFHYCGSLTTLDFGKNFYTSEVVRMDYMFNGCGALTSLDLGEKFDTSSVTKMDDMYAGCNALTSLDLGEKFDTSSVTDMSYMFEDCSSLTSLDLGEKFDTSSVTDMSYMFNDCSTLTNLDLGKKFDTSKVTDMPYMFFKCDKLTGLNLGKNFNTSSVTNMGSMFSGCSALTSLDLGDKFNTTNVTYMNSMFAGCSALTSLDLADNFDTTNVTNMDSMFFGCSSLKTLHLGPNFNKLIGEKMFSGCNSLTAIITQKECLTPSLDDIKVGDYIAYDNSDKTYTPESGNTGATGTTLTPDPTKWKVLKVNDDNETVLIATENVVNANEVTLYGISGYKNGADELNKICDALYGNEELGIVARSMTVEDVNALCGYTPSDLKKVAYYPNQTSVSGTTSDGYEMKAHGWGDARFYEYDKGGTTGTDSYGYTYSTPTSDNPVYVTNSYYAYNPIEENPELEGLFGKTPGWLASNCVNNYVTPEGQNIAYFGVFFLEEETLDAAGLYGSFGEEGSITSGLRPIITISLNDLESSTGSESSTEEGSTETGSTLVGNTAKKSVIELATNTGLENLPNAILYVPNSVSETNYEAAENYGTVFGADRIKPILELIGDKKVEVDRNETYTESGVTVAGFDNSEATNYTQYRYTVSEPVITKGGTKVASIDTSNYGTYECEYTLYYTDLNSNTKEVMSVTREVTVISKNYSVNGVYYSTLEDAYAGVYTVEGTIKVEKDNLDDSEFVIQPNKVITLDINGKTITKANYPIKNKGTLIIKGSGTIKDTDGTFSGLIDNTGMLTIGTNDSTAENLIIQSKTCAVNSETRFNFYDGILKGKTAAYNITEEGVTEPKIPANYEIGRDTETINGEEYKTAYLQPYQVFDECIVDKTAPVLDTYTIDDTMTVPGTVTINATFKDPEVEDGVEGSGVNTSATKYAITTTNVAPSADDDVWQESNQLITSSRSYAYIWARVVDNVGNVSVVGEMVADRTALADYIAPTIDGITVTYDEVSAKLTIKATDTNSGVEKITVNGTELDLTYNGDTATGEFEITEAGTYVIIARDECENESVASRTAYEILYNGNNADSGEVSKQIKINGVDRKLNVNTYIKAMHIFISWNDAQDGLGTNYSVGEMYSKDESVTMYAKWECTEIPIEITTQPQNVKLIEGESTILSVVANGSNIIYKWQVSTDGGNTWNDIPSETNNSLSLNNVAIDMNGNKYRCVLNNYYGDTYSNEVTLTVKVKLVIGVLQLKKNTVDGADYDADIWTDASVYVKLVQGSDGVTTYMSLDGSAQEVPETTGNTLISTTGITTLRVKTVRDEEELTADYIIKVDREAPEGGALSIDGKQRADDSTIKLKATGFVDNDSGIHEYVWEYKIEGDASFKQGKVDKSGNSDTYFEFDAVDNTTYIVRVIAYDNVGNSKVLTTEEGFSLIGANVKMKPTIRFTNVDKLEKNEATGEKQINAKVIFKSTSPLASITIGGSNIDVSTITHKVVGSEYVYEVSFTITGNGVYTATCEDTEGRKCKEEVAITAFNAPNVTYKIVDNGATREVIFISTTPIKISSTVPSKYKAEVTTDSGEYSFTNKMTVTEDELDATFIFEDKYGNESNEVTVKIELAINKSKLVRAVTNKAGNKFEPFDNMNIDTAYRIAQEMESKVTTLEGKVVSYYGNSQSDMFMSRARDMGAAIYLMNANEVKSYDGKIIKDLAGNPTSEIATYGLQGIGTKNEYVSGYLKGATSNALTNADGKYKDVIISTSVLRLHKGLAMADYPQASGSVSNSFIVRTGELTYSSQDGETNTNSSFRITLINK